MSVGRVSTLNLQQITLNNALNVESQINTEQQQISSGLNAQTFEGLNGQTEVVTSLNNQLSGIGMYLQNNQSVLTPQLNTASTALGSIITSANSALGLIIQQQNSSIAPSLNFTGQVQGIFQTIAGLLNTSVGGQYIFSGNATTTAPVDQNTLPTSQTPDTSYYLGSPESPTFTIQQGQTITPGVRADDPAFQNIMAGIAAAMSGVASGNTEALQNAYTLIQKGVSGVTALQGQIGATESKVNAANTSLTTEQVAMKTLHDNIVNSDPVSLSTQLATNSAVLSATFQAFVQINALQLSKYLA